MLNFWLGGAVMGFFMISGCLHKRPKVLTSFISQHAVRLLGPFFLFSIIYTLALSLLHKISIQQGIIETFTLQGAGMQLYFLPFFLLITVAYALASHGIPPRHALFFDSVLFVGLLVVTLIVRRPDPTGDDYHLLPLFASSLLFGRLSMHFKNTSRFWFLSFGIIVVLVLVGLYDARFYCLGFTATLVTLAQGLNTPLPRRRLPGSGGVYLLHTPILNYAISTVLQNLGIHQWSNIIASVFLTYAVALALTLLAIKSSPKLKWLLLE